MSDLMDRLQESLGDTYHFERELDGGGMSRVFLAEESALGRQVVVKVLPPDTSLGVSVERFRREIQVAARLQHPHIVPLLTAGSADGLLYYVMPFIRGESLRDRLARMGELPIAEVTRLARDIADALAYAHREGVVHRDIKPGNVMLTDGHALVMDFGVAKAVSEAAGGDLGDAPTVTSMGVALGTPAYMAPEQAAGDPQTDHRADLYAFGVLVYEMLTGRVPFSGPTSQAVLSAQITQPPTPVTTHRETVPPALSELVMRCLAKKPADRWQRGEEIRGRLDELAGSTASLTPVPAATEPSSGTRQAIRRAHPLRVTALFGAASALALAAVYWVMHLAGLPDWVFAGAVVLLALGLPIMLLTGREERRRAEARGGGGPVRSVGGLGWLFTWRRAVGGGVLAFTTLALLTGTFMGLRALGVGPFGTLLSAGVLEHQDRLLLADFENATDDPRMGETVTELVRIDLAQSPVVTLMEPPHVRAVLERMRLQPGEPLTVERAAEVAAREGVKAYVAGEVRQVGDGYVLSARLVAAEGGEVLAAVRETASGLGDLVRSADRLSSRLRERLGESLRTVRASPPLEQVTTASLEALRLYAHAERVADLGDEDRAITLLEEAVEVDPTFAMAYRRLGAFYGNRGDRARADAALEEAYRLRDRLTARERYHVEALHAMNVLRDPERAAATYHTLLELHPLDGTALNNLAVAYNRLGRMEDLIDVLERAIAADVASAVAYVNVLPARLAGGDLAAADSLIGLLALRFPGNARIPEMESERAFAARDFELSEAKARELVGGSPAQRVFAYMRLGALAQIRGRLDEAARYRRSALELHGARAGWSPAQREARIELDSLIVAAWSAEEPERLAPAVEALWSRWQGISEGFPPEEAAVPAFVWAFVKTGRPERARQIHDAYLAEFGAPDGLQLEFRLEFQEASAGLPAAEGRALESVEAYREFCADWVELYGPCRDGFPLLAEVYEAAGQPDSARAIYERYADSRSLALPISMHAEQWWWVPVHERLGALYEAAGDHARAAESYRRFAELWRDADPPLRARAEAAQRRAASLAEGAGEAR